MQASIKIRKQRHASPAVGAVGNEILAALLGTEYRRLLPKLERVSLKRGDIVYRADQKIARVYFPEDAVIAIVDTAVDGSTIEVGIIGHEGLVGINIFLGGAVTPDKAIVQLAGSAFMMESKKLRKEIRVGSALQRLLLDYTRTFLAVISQSVACSQHHTVEQRLARWLLTMNDYAHMREIQMVHDSIASMLGVRRVSVTDAAQSLQVAGLISYQRGHIRVLDKAGLAKKSCECYRFIREQYQSLHGTLPKILAGE